MNCPKPTSCPSCLNRELAGKKAVACKLGDCGKLEDLGFINIYASDFDRLVDGAVESAVSRGNVIRLKFSNRLNLILAPEYGWKILYHPKQAAAPAKFHLEVAFADDSAFTVTLSGMGIIQALKDSELQNSYVYRRDFSTTPSPLDDTFSFEAFAEALAGRAVNFKTLLVGKDAAVVGLGNSAFQDIIYRAGIHPKRKASELSDTQKRALYDAVKHVVSERIRLGGKEQFVDFYGKQGGYVAAMGPNMKDKPCLACGTEVEKLSLGGGQTFFCPNCQT